MMMEHTVIYYEPRTVIITATSTVTSTVPAVPHSLSAAAVPHQTTGTEVIEPTSCIYTAIAGQPSSSPGQQTVCTVCFYVVSGI